MQHRRRGTSVGTYITAIAAFMVLIFTLVSMAIQHLHFSSVAYQQQAAKNLAEAAIHKALVKVLNSPSQNFGVARLPAEVVRITTSHYPQGSQGIVCFHGDTARREKIPLSLNNFRGDGQVLGSLGRSVPINTLHLVATGTCGGYKRTLETLFYVPPFPSALASEGPVRSRGALLVAGVKDPSKFPGNYEDLPPEEKAPSHVFSNFTSDKAVELGAGAVVQGNVGAVGGIIVDPAVTVAGEIRPHSEPQPLPQLDLVGVFNRLDRQVGKDLLGSTVNGDYDLQWNAQCNGDLHITGSLQLNQGILFVKGNLQVDGGVTGEGAIYVGGTTLIQRGADLRASDQIAVVSRDKITLRGAGQSAYFFQGLLYSEADVLAKDITVLGAVIARGLGGLDFENVNLLNSPVTISLIEGLELINASDDDTVQIVIRVEQRDPVTRKPLAYKVRLSGRSDDVGTNDGPVTLSPPQEAHGLKNYDEIKRFIQTTDRGVWGPWAKNSFRLEWLWNSAGEHTNVYGEDPLQTYLDMLEGKVSDPSHIMTINLNPNEVLGILDRSRVLLWREVPNPGS